MKNILVIAECINKDKTSEGISTSNFLNALAKGPFKIDCLYLQQVQHELKDVSHIDSKVNLIKINNNFIDDLVYKLKRVKGATAKLFGINLLRTRRASKFQSALKPIISDGNYDLLFVRTIAGSMASHTAVFNLSKALDFKWVVNFNDPAPITLMPYPYFNGKIKYPKQIVKDEAFVKEVVKSCDGISTPSVLLTKRFLDFAGITEKNTKVFRFPHIFFPPKHIKTPSFLDQSKFNIVHPGSLLGPRNPKFLLDAFHKFIELNSIEAKDVRLVFFGAIHPSHKPLFEAFTHKNQLEIRDKRIPHEEALGVLAESDVLIILEAIAEESPFMPGKLAEFIGLNKTIWALSPEKSETRRILGNKYPWQCEANNEAMILSQLQNLFDLYKTNTDFGLNDNTIKRYVSPENAVDEMSHALNVISP